MIKLILSLMLLIPSLALSADYRPSKVSEFYKTSVRIYNPDESSGGTGSVFRSFDNATHILTNKHVCRLVEQGGIIEHAGNKYDVTHYKKFPTHDLCLVRIKTGLSINTVISDVIYKRSITTYVSGHPNLLPHIVTKGHMSDRIDIKLVVGVKKCKEGDNDIRCAWFGGKPVVKTFDSQLISNLIKPGNSGSAVFNGKGEIVGVVYAGDSRGFSFGYIVPQIYVIFFVQNAHRYKWVKVGTPVDEEDWIDRVFNYKICENDEKELFDFCLEIKNNMIWRK